MAYKLLLVDDDKDTINNLEPLLAKEGYQARAVYGGSEALGIMDEYKPDIILLDLMMPGMNGFDVLKEVREKHKDKWYPVIILSTRSEMDTLKKCYDLEADFYLPKPVVIDDLLRGIKTMISLISARIT